MTAHSHLGASGAHRWMNCSGSVALSAMMPESDDTPAPSYRTEGSAAHELAADLLREGGDAWQFADRVYLGIRAENLDLEAVQEYVDFARACTAGGGRVFIEHMIGEKEEGREHEALFGTVDYAVLNPEGLTIIDFKYGAGVAVDPVENPQLMYYAYGLLAELEDPPEVVFINIVQPRVPGDAHVKPWRTTSKYILGWGRDILLPKMQEVSEEKAGTFVAGDWCRFCPAKLACPLLRGMFGAAATASTAWFKDALPLSLGQEYQRIEAVKMYLRAVEGEVYNRLMAGTDVEGTKLVQKRASRVWKPEAAGVITEKFGELAFNPAEMKSPAELEKLGTAAKSVVYEWAYTPETGLTVALSSDRRPAARVETPSETFASFIDGGENP